MNAERRPWPSVWLGLFAAALAVRFAAWRGLRPLMEEDAWRRLMILHRFVADPSWPPGYDYAWPPGYTLLLAPFAWLSLDPRFLSLVNALLGAAAIAPLFLLTRELFGKQHARLAAALLAVFPLYAEYTVQLMSEGPYLLLLLAALWLFFRYWRTENQCEGFAAALLLGLAGMIRVECFGLIPVFAAAAALGRRRGWWWVTLVAALPPTFWIANNLAVFGVALEASRLSVAQVAEAKTAAPLGSRLSYLPWALWTALSPLVVIGALGGVWFGWWPSGDDRPDPRRVTGRRLYLFAIAVLAGQLLGATIGNRLIFQQARYVLPIAILLLPFFTEFALRIAESFTRRRLILAGLLLLVAIYWGWQLSALALHGQVSSGFYLPPDNPVMRELIHP